MAAESDLPVKEVLDAELDRHLSAILAYDNLCLNNLKKVQELTSSNNAANALKITNSIINEIALITKIRQEVFFNRVRQINSMQKRENTLLQEIMQRNIQVRNDEFAIHEEQIQAQKALQQALQKEYISQQQKIKEQEYLYQAKIKECEGNIVKLTEIISKIDHKSDQIMQKILTDISENKVTKDFKIGINDLTYQENELADRAKLFFEGKIEDGTIDSSNIDNELETIAQEYIYEILINNNVDIENIDARELSNVIDNAVISLKSAIRNNSSISSYDDNVNKRIACGLQLNLLKEFKSSLEIGLIELKGTQQEHEARKENFLATNDFNNVDFNLLTSFTSNTSLELQANSDFFKNIDGLPFEIPDFDFMDDLDIDNLSTEQFISSPPGGPAITEQYSISPPGGPSIDNDTFEENTAKTQLKTTTASIFQQFGVKTAKSDESVLEEEKAKQSTPTPSERALDSKKSKQESNTNVQTPEREEPASPRMRR